MSNIHYHPFRICPDINGKYNLDLIQNEKFYGSLNLGNGTEFHVGLMLFPLGSGLFIGLERIGSFGFFSIDEPFLPSYVGKELGLGCNYENAKNIADFINQVLGIDTQGQIFGTYHEKFLN